MKPKAARPGSVIQSSHALVAIACVALLSSGNATLRAQTAPATQPAVQETVAPAAEAPAPKIPSDQLDSLVAPIALYPDTLLAQTMAAATYPLEIIQLQQWMQKNKNLKDKALVDAVAKEKWDPSVQSLAGMPDVVERLATNIQWTTDLGNAFLDQQQDVMDAVQRMRAKAQGKGALKTSQEQTVETKTVEGNKEVIVIQQPNPEVVYVPSYDPTVVYGPPAYPYYPYTYPGYVPGMGLAMGTGIVLGAAWANNNWGNCDWNNGGNININNNNNFNRNNINNINRNTAGNRNNWQHNPQHRGPAPYSNKSTANKYGGTDRGGPNTKGPGGDRTSTNRPSNDRPSTKPSGADRSSANRPSGDRPSTKPSGADRSSANRPSGGDRSSAKGPSGGNQIANRQVSHSPSPKSNSAFGSGGGSRSSAAASHSRGSQSMGGGSRGGGHGGGSRGGGRRR